MAGEIDIPQILERLDVGIFVLDRGMRIAHWNRFMASITGRSAEEVVGQEVFVSFPGLPEAWLRRKCDVVFLLGHSAFSSWAQRPFLFECPSRLALTAGLSTMRQDCTFSALKDAEGEVAHVCIVVKDVTETAAYETQLRTALAEIEEISRLDGLTGVPNRRHIEQRLEVEFARHKRYGAPLAVAMLDIDHFKVINDTYGHLFGDEVLRSLARTVAATLRTHDVFGRYGGEEFLIILPGVQGDQSFAAADRVRRVIESLDVSFDGRRVPISASLGVCDAGEGHGTPDDVIRDADRALYRAKANGRNGTEAADGARAAADAG